MLPRMIEYKGYEGIFEFEEKRQLFRGKIVNINELLDGALTCLTLSYKLVSLLSELAHLGIN